MEPFIIEKNGFVRRLALSAPNFVAVCMASIVIAVIISYRDVTEIIRSSRWIHHTYEVLMLLEKTMESLRIAESNQRGYIITGDTKYLDRCKSAVEPQSSRISRIRELTRDNKSQRPMIDAFEKTANARIEELDHIVSVYKSDGPFKARETIASDVGYELMGQTIAAYDKIRESEELLLRERRKWFDRIFRRLVPEIIFLKAMFVLFAYFLWMSTWKIRPNNPSSQSIPTVSLGGLPPSP